ncbi:MAG: DUF2911 domain-containing protein, partial [Chitinophagaceae bacterium]
MNIKTNRSFLFLTIVCIAFACKEKQKEVPAENHATPDSAILEPSAAVINAFNNTIDKSPMDMIYFPVDYPKIKMANSTIAPPIARVIYSRPHLAKRHLFHDLL